MYLGYIWPFEYVQPYNREKSHLGKQRPTQWPRESSLGALFLITCFNVGVREEKKGLKEFQGEPPESAGL